MRAQGYQGCPAHFMQGVAPRGNFQFADERKQLVCHDAHELDKAHTYTNLELTELALYFGVGGADLELTELMELMELVELVELVELSELMELE